MTNCFMALCAQLLLGGSYETSPPNGTWWQADQPHSFGNLGASYGLSLVGKNWSLSAERMGRMTSSAVACAANEPACRNGSVPYSHWYGIEHPYGAWASWEPHFGGVFGQIGVGAVNPDFSMRIPDWNDGHVMRSGTVGNHRVTLSPLAGVGYRTGVADVIFNWRLVRAQNIGQIEYQGLGWGVFNLSLRSEF